jgi:hypothetical protein
MTPEELLKRRYEMVIYELMRVPFDDRFARDNIGKVRKKGEIGIELECEGRVRANNIGFSKFWDIHNDNSLRDGGIEFVLRNPINFNKLDQALNDWEQIVVGSEFHNSIRTSVHVHLNVNKLPLVKILTAISVYWLLENVLVAYCGRPREGNLFCLRCKDAEHQVTALVNAIAGQNAAGYCMSEHLKYSSLNLYSLTQYGSLEIRPMRGLYKKEDIREWVVMCYNLVFNSMRLFEHPEDVINHYFKVGQDKFLLDVFNDPWFVDKLKRGKCENTWEFQESIENNIPYIFEVVSLLPDWRWVREGIEKGEAPVFHDEGEDEEGRDWEEEQVLEEPIDEEEEEEMMWDGEQGMWVRRPF